MYFNNFKNVLYEFPNVGEDKSNKRVIVKDITTNIRFRKFFIENLPLYETYKVQDGDTPEIISEKLYGTPAYHWIVMLLNQRYDYISDFPQSIRELELMIARKYGNAVNLAHHFVDSSGDVTTGYCNVRVSKGSKGTINITEGKVTVTGVGTAFKEQITVGNTLVTDNDEYIGIVEKIDSNTVITLTDVSTISHAGSYKCVIPVEVGDVIRTKTSIGYSVGRIESMEGNNYTIMLTTSSFSAGNYIEIYKYYDDADGNFVETFKGHASITSVSYPELTNIVTNWDYEYGLNEQKREIKVLPSKYLDQVLTEFKDLLLS